MNDASSPNLSFFPYTFNKDRINSFSFVGLKIGYFNEEEEEADGADADTDQWRKKTRRDSAEQLVSSRVY